MFSTKPPALPRPQSRNTRKNAPSTRFRRTKPPAASMRACSLLHRHKIMPRGVCCPAGVSTTKTNPPILHFPRQLPASHSRPVVGLVVVGEPHAFPPVAEHRAAVPHVGRVDIADLHLLLLHHLLLWCVWCGGVESCQGKDGRRAQPTPTLPYLHNSVLAFTHTYLLPLPLPLRRRPAAALLDEARHGGGPRPHELRLARLHVRQDVGPALLCGVFCCGIGVFTRWRWRRGDGWMVG